MVGVCTFHIWAEVPLRPQVYLTMLGKLPGHSSENNALFLCKCSNHDSRQLLMLVQHCARKEHAFVHVFLVCHINLSNSYRLRFAISISMPETRVLHAGAVIFWVSVLSTVRFTPPGRDCFTKVGLCLRHNYT
eukprot:4068747-Amphidinium_carterae.1